MANDFCISAGLPPIDNSSGATANSFYIAAGLIPTDTAGEPTPITKAALDSEQDWILLA